MSVEITCKEDSLKVARAWSKGGTEREKEKSRGGEEGVESDQGRDDRHLNTTAQCPCYGQMYSTFSRIYRQTILQYSSLQRSQILIVTLNI